MTQPPPPDELKTATRVANAAIVVLVIGFFVTITAWVGSMFSGGLSTLTTVALIVGIALVVLGMSTSVLVASRSVAARSRGSPASWPRSSRRSSRTSPPRAPS